MRVERGGELFVGESIAPCGLDGVDGSAAAFHHVLHAGAEDTVDADDGFVAGLEEVRGDAFHAGHAGAADGEGEGVLRAEDLAEHGAGFVHDLEVLRIEMAERGRAQCAQDAMWHGAGARTHEDAFGGIGLRCGGHVKMWEVRVLPGA